MSFKGNSNGSLSLKKFTNNRYNAEFFEQPENPTAIDEITRCVCKPDLEEDELIGLVFPGTFMTLPDGTNIYAWKVNSYVSKVVYDGKVVEGLYHVDSGVLADLKTMYDAQNNFKFLIYVSKSGRIISLSKSTPWQTIVDYLDSLKGGE